MRGNRRAILADIHERNLDPKVAHSNVDKSGRMFSVEHNEQLLQHDVKEKVVFASTKGKKQHEVEEKVIEETVDNLAPNLEPAEIVAEQSGFLIPSIAKKVADVSTVEETSLPNVEVTAEDKSAKKSKKKKSV